MGITLTVDVLGAAAVCTGVSTGNVFRIVLMGQVDALILHFLWIDLGGYGHKSDAQHSHGTITSRWWHTDAILDLWWLWVWASHEARCEASNDLTKNQSLSLKTVDGSAHRWECFQNLASAWQILLTAIKHDPNTITINVDACVNFHSLMCLQYTTLHGQIQR